MDAATRTPVDLARWITDRSERLSRLTPDDGLAFDLRPAEAQRLIAYAGFSLFRATRALEVKKQASRRAVRNTRPAKVAV
jgi:hypothetical protein